MARSIVSFGMFAALASLTVLRRRGFWFGSPLPPVRAAIVSSLISLVKSFPRLASSAPFLCLIECHFECPDIGLVPLYDVRLSAGNIRVNVTANIARLFGNRKLNLRFMNSPPQNIEKGLNPLTALCILRRPAVAVHPPENRCKGKGRT